MLLSGIYGSVKLQNQNDFWSYSNTLLQFGMLASFGGIANYFHYVEKRSQTFSVFRFLCSISLSFFVGMVTGDFIRGHANLYGIVMLCGYFSYPIINRAQESVVKIFDKLLKKIE